jgi:uncharacterized protein involved in exopolysaccharide biosynthesis
MQENEATLFDYLATFVKWRRVFIVNLVVVALLTTIVSLILPKWYRATAVIMTPEDDAGAIDVAALLSNLPVNVGGLGISLGPTESMNYLAILRSRTVWENIIYRFDLQRVYKEENIELTLKELNENVEFTVGKEGQIIVEVLDKSPGRAAAMANAFVSQLDSLNKIFKIDKARSNRLWLQRRFEENTQALHAAEQNLKTFKQQHGVIDIPEQTKAAIAGAAELQADIYAAEIELAVKEKYFTSTNEEILKMRAEVQELKRKLSELESGAGLEGANGKNAPHRLFIPFAELPDLALEYARLYRNVLVQGKLFEVIFQMYEQAKIQEAKDTPTVQILDTARTPIRKAKPKRALMIILSGFLSLVVTGLFVFTKEFLNRVEISGGRRAEQWQWIREQLRHESRKRFRR